MTTHRRPFALFRAYPYSLTFLSVVLVIIIVLLAVNAGVASGNSARIDLLNQQLEQQKQQTAIERKNSTAFINDLLKELNASCGASLDADHRLGAAAANPKVCVVAIPTASP